MCHLHSMMKGLRHIKFYALLIFRSQFGKLDVVTHACNLSTRKADVEGSLGIQGQLIRHSETLSQKEETKTIVGNNIGIQSMMLSL